MVNIFCLLFVRTFFNFISNTSVVSINFLEQIWMLRMQEMAFPAFTISNIFWGSMPPDPLFMRGTYHTATHVAFGHCYPL